MLVLDQSHFSFSDGTMHVDLAVSLSRNNALVFSKQYSADGSKQLGRMFAEGAFGTTKIILGSTTVALDDIFGSVAKDLQDLPEK